MLAFDAWVIRRVFQPIVDALVHWRTHYGLAKLCMQLASGAMLATAVLLIFTMLWWSSVFYVIGAWCWWYNVNAYHALEELEAKGFVPQPIVWMAYMRVAHLLVLLILLVATGCFVELFILVALPVSQIFWIASTTVGWVFAAAAHYFAACNPGTPRRRPVFQWQPA